MIPDSMKTQDLINRPEYDDGVNACMAGMELDFNPNKERDAANAWEMGWKDADKEMKKE